MLASPPTAAARSARAGVLVALLVVLAYVPGLSRYGPTWDLCMGEQAVGHVLLGRMLSGDATLTETLRASGAVRRHTEVRQPHPAVPDELLAPQSIYPLSALIAAASCELLWERWGVLPAMAAHNLPALLAFALVVGWAVAFALRRVGVVAAGVTLGALVASPRLLAHAQHNIKDVPEMALYALAYAAAWRALMAPSRGAAAAAHGERAGLTDEARGQCSEPTRGESPSVPVGARWWPWVAVAVWGGLALAQKANAVLLPVQVALLWLALRVGRGPRRPVFPWRGLVVTCSLAPLVWFAVSPWMWDDTAARFGSHVEFIRRMGSMPGTPDPLFVLSRVAWTTPLPVLALAALALVSVRLRSGLGAFLVLGAAVPLARTVFPLRTHDGVRHVLEAYPFLALLAGVGAQWIVDRLAPDPRGARGAPLDDAALVGPRHDRVALAGAPASSADLAERDATGGVADGPGRRRRFVSVLVVLFAVGPGGVSTARSWPHGVAWFNDLVGGLPGARADRIQDATDYWGNSYWDGLAWLRDHGELGADVIVPVARHVVEAAAPVRLRDDLTLLAPGAPKPDGTLYVMTIRRPGRTSQELLRWLRTEPMPVHVITVQGEPILTIHRFARPDEVERAWSMWSSGQRDLLSVFAPVARWLGEHRPDVFEADGGFMALMENEGLMAVAERLRDVLPESLQRHVDEIEALADEAAGR